MDYTDIEEWQEWWAHTIGSKICRLLGRHKVETSTWSSWCSRCWTPAVSSTKILTRRPDDAQSLVGQTTTGTHPPFSQEYHRRVRITPTTQDSTGQELDTEPPTKGSTD